MEYDHLFKLLIVGDSGCGKSALLMRYVDSEFQTAYMTTIGVDFKVKTVDVRGKKIKLQIWDTAGQERFRTITSSYYRGAHAIMVVYDVNEATSFQNVKHWIDEVHKNASRDVPMIIVGTKADSETRREVSSAEAAAFGAKCGYPMLEASSKTPMGVDEAFQLMVDGVLGSLEGASSAAVVNSLAMPGVRKHKAGKMQSIDELKAKRLKDKEAASELSAAAEDWQNEERMTRAIDAVRALGLSETLIERAEKRQLELRNNVEAQATKELVAASAEAEVVDEGRLQRAIEHAESIGLNPQLVSGAKDALAAARPVDLASLALQGLGDAEVKTRLEDAQTIRFNFLLAEAVINFDGERLPIFQEAARAGMIVTRPIARRGACAQVYRRQYLAVSHRWESPTQPDTMAEQLRALKAYLLRKPSIQYVFFDFSCMPQGADRTPEELLEFKSMLYSMNLLYFGCSVLVLMDRSYLSRFWVRATRPALTSPGLSKRPSFASRAYRRSLRRGSRSRRRAPRAS